MIRTLDDIVADAQARLASNFDGEDGIRLLVNSRTVCALNVPADFALDDEIKADLLAIPPVAEALRGREVQKWLVSERIINIITGEPSARLSG